MPADVLYRFMKLLCKIRALNRLTSDLFRVSVHTVIKLQSSKNHFGVFNKVAVYRNPIWSLTEMNPVRLNNLRSVALLEKDYISRDLSPGIFLESVVRKPNCTEQIGAFSDVFSDFRRLLVHRVSARDERDHAARSDLIESFRHKIVVD